MSHLPSLFDVGPISRNYDQSSWFGWLLSTQSDETQRLRKTADVWWRSCPASARQNLAGKIRSGDDTHAHGAVTEMFLAAHLGAAGFEIRDGLLNDLTPDYNAKSPNGGTLILEVTTMNESARDVGRRKRQQTLVAALDDDSIDRQPVPHSMLRVTFWSTGASAPPTSTIRKAVLQWLQDDVAMISDVAWFNTSSLAPQPTLWWRQRSERGGRGEFHRRSLSEFDRYRVSKELGVDRAGWLVSFGAIPHRPSVRATSTRDDRSKVGLRSDGQASFVPESRVPGAVARKVAKYGRLATSQSVPLVVAVGDPNWMSFDQQERTSLFEGTSTACYEDHDGELILSRIIRNQDGLWHDPRMSHLAALVCVDSARWMQLDLRIRACVPNPQNIAVSVMDLCRVLQPATTPELA